MRCTDHNTHNLALGTIRGPADPPLTSENRERGAIFCVASS